MKEKNMLANRSRIAAVDPRRRHVNKKSKQVMATNWRESRSEPAEPI